MIPLLLFLFWLGLLLVEGSLIVFFVAGNDAGRLFRIASALPVSAFLNVLIVFLFTIVHVPLVWWTFLLGHALIISLCFVLVRQRRVVHALPTQRLWLPLPKSVFRAVLRISCIVLLSLQFFFSFTHSVILPTYQIDSLTNWTMRSKVSFYDHAIAFDPTEVRGVAKPQYPFLFHAVQMIVNEGNAEWNDRSANAILFLLTLSSFAATFALLRRQKHFDHALVGITLLFGIPLLTFHLAQGYADIVLIQYLILAFTTLWLYRLEHRRCLLWLSALFVLAAAWTKTEGLIVGIFLWLLMLLPLLKHSVARRAALAPALSVLCISSLFPVFLFLRGMSLTPHGTDTHVGWHADAFAAAFTGLFTGGSMGITWFVLPTAICILLSAAWKKSPCIDRSALIFGWWGALSLSIILFTYVFTPNAVFLESGESYYRQLIIPAALLLLWCVILWKEEEETSGQTSAIDGRL